MKVKLWHLFASLLFTLSFMGLVSAQTGQISLEEDFDYSSLDQMQAAGWAFTRPAGISVSGGAVTLDGTGGDCAINRPTSFSNNVNNWKAEVRAMWLGQGHSVLSVFVYTAEHSYGWAADGYYKEYSFYRDSQKILHFGNYAEKADEDVILTMVREGSTFSFYFNSNLINTYTEEDTTPSKVTSLALVSPWRGDAKYDYLQLSETNAVVVPSNPVEATGGFPLVPVLIGGGITAAVVGGIAVYYFFIAGGSSASAGASAGGSVGSAGGEGTGGSNEGGGSVIQEQPISPLGQTGVGSSQPTGVGSSQPIVSGGQTGVAPGGQTGVGSGVSQTNAVAGAQTNVVGGQTNVSPLGQTGVGSSQPIVSGGQTGVDNRSVDFKKAQRSSENEETENTSDSTE